MAKKNYPLTVEAFEMIVACSFCGRKIKIIVKPNQTNTDYDILPEKEGLGRIYCNTCRHIAYKLTKKLRRTLRRFDKEAYEEAHIFRT